MTMTSQSLLRPAVPRSLTDIYPSDETDLAAQIESVLSTGETSGGLFLVTGRTGDGTSTTLAALVDTVFNTMPDRLVSVVDDMHSPGTAQAALNAVEAGHLVLASMYAVTAAHVPLGLVSLGSSPAQLSDTVLGVLNQRLLRTLCEHCSTDGQPHGCEHCQHSGWLGRAAIGTLLPYTATVGDIVAQAERDAADAQRRFERSNKRGDTSFGKNFLAYTDSAFALRRTSRAKIAQHAVAAMPEHAATLVSLGRTTVEQAAKSVGNDEFKQATASDTDAPQQREDVDPLSQVFRFADYPDLLREPVNGKLDPSFVCGVGEDGEPIRFHWDDPQPPHLLIAGSRNVGKSGVVHSMLTQMLHNNHPDDLHVWMLEPKHELQRFQHCEHVRVFVDQHVTTMSEHEAAAHVLEAGVAEMHERYEQFHNHPRKIPRGVWKLPDAGQRYEQFVSHPQQPRSLAEARAFAEADPEVAGHLKYPLLFIVIEESASYLEEPALREDKKMHQRLVSALSEITRRGRAAGIHVVLVAQNPTRRSLPATVKRQCRTIGLSTRGDSTMSQVIVDSDELAWITAQGCGLVRSGGRAQPFRSLLMGEHPSTPSSAEPDAGAEAFHRLPVSVDWPKLPATVDATPELGSLTEELATKREAAAERMAQWLAAKPATTNGTTAVTEAAL